MIKKSMCSALLMVLCCLPVISDAAVCRSGDAAQAGSTAGYEQAKKASDAWAALEREASSRLQDCLDRIRTTSNGGSTAFFSLQDLINQVAEQICTAAVNKINKLVPNGIDPWIIDEVKGTL